MGCRDEDNGQDIGELGSGMDGNEKRGMDLGKQREGKREQEVRA
jgi:hypothetical protein